MERRHRRYGDGLTELGFELFTGTGGFHHWGRLPGELTAGGILIVHLFGRGR